MLLFPGPPAQQAGKTRESKRMPVRCRRSQARSGSLSLSWLLCMALVVACLGAGCLFFAHQVRGLFTRPFQTAIFGWDDTFYYVWLRSAFIGGDVDFTDDVASSPSLPRRLKMEVLRGPRTEKGLIPNKYPVGWALSSAPFYLMADSTVTLANAAGGCAISHDGNGPVYQFVILLGQLLYALAGLLLCFLILRRFLPVEPVIVGIGLTWVGSFLFYYQTVDLTMAHSTTFFWIVLTYYLVLLIDDKPERARYWPMLGIAAGMVILSRYQAAAYLLFPAVVALRAVVARKARVAPLLLAAGLFAGVLFIQMAAWRALYGHWLLYTYSETFDWFNPHLPEVLFSPFHGLYYWHPILLLATVGFVAGVATIREIPRSWLVVLFATIWINAAWSCWWFAASFGSRAFEGCMLFFMAGSAWIIARLWRRKALLGLVVALYLLAAAWNLNLAWLVNENVIPGDRPVTWRQMASTTLRYYAPPNPPPRE